MAFVASFPHLSASEFNLACQELVLRFEKARQTNGRWESVETKVHNHETYLRISNSLPLPENRAAKDSTEEMPDEVETAEDDEEAVVPQRDSLPIIHYDILLSPTYQVPVLYFHISDSLHRFPSTLTTLYSHVVPAEFTAQTKHIGVLGGITINVSYELFYYIWKREVTCYVGSSAPRPPCFLYSPVSYRRGNGSK